MNKIAVLDKITIDKIAAGEVVERPSSVVKELVENAIDAGATAVTVEAKEGGKTFIRITDNGAGIPREQVPLAFLRHATSKIESAEDLYEIASLGFRGEALSSISAVAQVELITKTISEVSGVRYVIEGGQEKTMEDIGAPDGTTFLVRNIFYNTPARSKFLKTSVTEGGYISSLMEQMALSHPEISFKYILNGQVKLHSSGNGNQKDVIYQIYGRDLTKDLLEVNYENEYLEIHGFIGKPSVSRGNRSFENYYVNGRYVKNKILTRAIEDAYKGFMMQHRFPFVSLQITMTGNDLDVNVHPTKMEVRFSREQDVYHTVYQVLSDVLYHKELIPEVSFEREKMSAKPKVQIPKAQVPEPFEKSRLTEAKSIVKPSVPEIQRPINVRAEEPAPVKTEHKTNDRIQEETVYPKPDSTQFRQETLLEQPMLTQEARKCHRLIGQLFDTYWLVQFGDAFYIIDQHAAHEKCFYERIMSELKSRNITSQYLSPPIIVPLTLEEETLLKENMNVFTSFGFEIEPFGGREYSIRAVPSNLYNVAEKDLFLEILAGLSKEGRSHSPEIILDRLAIVACKAAVKGNQKLSAAEADHLIDELLQLENPYNCPHGRPTIISMTKNELEKKFKRIV